MSARSRRGYKNALVSLATRTGTPLPSLIISFAILHEITAIVPLAGIFLGAKYLGVGERLMEFVRAETHTDVASPNQPSTTEWVQGKVGTWIDEGEVWAEKVGRRYGFFGFPKTPKGVKSEFTEGEGGPWVAGDVANAVFAYTATKALVPVRLGVSFYLSPGFSRRAVEPIRKGLMFVLRRGRA